MGGGGGGGGSCAICFEKKAQSTMNLGSFQDEDILLGYFLAFLLVCCFCFSFVFCSFCLYLACLLNIHCPARIYNLVKRKQ